MKKIFTKVKMFLVVALAFCAINTQAQVNITVDGLGTYEGSLGDFAFNDPCGMDDIVTMVRMINDGTPDATGCSPYIDSDLAGKIAVMNIGDCDAAGNTTEFEDQAANAESNGAVGAVICHDIPDRRPMRPDPNSDVNIPTILVSLQDCFNLKNALAGGSELMATMFFDDRNIDPAVTVVWGDGPDQGTFDNGLGGWTVENCSVVCSGTVIQDAVTWQWYENPVEDWFSTQMVSYSRCNGAAGYDVTRYNIDNCDISNPNTYPDHHCELISPIIDLTGVGAVSLQFWQINFGLNGNDNPGDPVSRVFISYDGGMTYTDQINVESGNILTADRTEWANEELRRFSLPQLAGESNVRLKFEFHGDFYSWYIDDVLLIETPENSLTLDESYYSQAPSAMTPINLVDDIVAVSRVSNTGTTTQPNTEVTVTYTGPTSSFETTVPMGDLQADSTAAECGAELFTPTELGVYSVDMSADSDLTDFDYNDNSTGFLFEVTESLWAKDNGTVNGIVRPADAPDFVWGAIYSVPDDYTGSDMIKAIEFGFELADSIDNSDQFVSWSIQEWDDANANGTCEAAERTFVTGNFISFNFTSPLNGEMNIIDLEADPDVDPVDLEAGKNYILAVEWAESSRELNIFGYNGVDYTGMIDAYNGGCIENARFNDVIGIGTDRNGDWSIGGWTSRIAPAMRIYTETPSVSSNEIEIDFNVTMFPNPVVDELNIALSFEEIVPELELTITDITGRVLAIQNDTKVSEATYRFDTAKFAPGVYFAKIATDEGIATQRFVKGN